MKKQRTKKDRLLTYLYLAILIFLILFLFFNKYGLLKYFELKSEINAIEREIERSKNEIKELDENIESLKKSDKELEKVAREKFHLKKKNEKAFKFEDKKDTLN
ncbi:MAG: septum formation initiator family protein [Ignavibacteriae bacterium]|nr:septum formation initiator family protein [Ignavibacteriota bacterium]MCB9210255.1 septum formation initiator family protein [Ignavibacteriales bacterium]MCB9219050.1 septum formation initiator family protein [Ignavibacteriales bacterium]